MRMNLKTIRETNGLTQKQVAERLGICTRFYQHIEAGTRKGNIDLWDKLEDLFVTSQKILRANTTI